MIDEERLIDHIKTTLLEQGKLITCLLVEGPAGGGETGEAVVDCLLPEGVPSAPLEALDLFFGLGQKQAEHKTVASLTRLHFATEVWMKTFQIADPTGATFFRGGQSLGDLPDKEEALMVQTLDCTTHATQTRLWTMLRSGAGLDLVRHYLPDTGLGVVSNGPILQAFELGFLLGSLDGEPPEQAAEKLAGLLERLRFGNLFIEGGGVHARKHA